MNFQMNPTVLSQIGNDVNESAKKIDDSLSTIKTSVDTLSGWNSEAKNNYVNKINADLVKMQEMAQVIKSYGDVAYQVAEKVSSIENNIRNSINK